MRVGEVARHDPSPEVAAAASELASSALRLGMNAKLATLVLYGRLLLPDARISIGGKVTDIYEKLTQELVRLTASRTRLASHAFLQLSEMASDENPHPDEWCAILRPRGQSVPRSSEG